MKTRIAYPLTLLWQADLALRRADHIFCLNNEDRAYLATHFGRDLGDVTRIFPAANPVFGREAENRDYGRARILLFAGTWLARKGIRDLAAAFARIAATRDDILLRVLNPGVKADVVLRDFPAACRPQVEVVTAAPEAGTAEAMEQADLFVLPSRFEGTPLTMMEAMWSGLPIVSTAVCGMKDVIRHGSNGLLVGPGDSNELEKALQWMLCDGELRRKLGRQAYEDAVRSYRWSDAASVVLQAYERLTKTARDGSGWVRSETHAEQRSLV
jgi:glycosyltransferase involved in cell wall biosynthesis